MVRKNTLFKTMLQQACKNALTLTCPCHSAALAAHFAYRKIPTYCDDFVKKIANYINSSPKHSAIYEEFNESFQKNSHKILKLSTTRWLSHYSAIERLLQSWGSVKNFLLDMAFNEKSKT